LPRLRATRPLRGRTLGTTPGHFLDQPANQIDHPIGLRRIGHLRRQPILQPIDDLRRPTPRGLLLQRGLSAISQRPGVVARRKSSRRQASGWPAIPL